ncbi:hypothetical protein MHU86_6186 [Fragilaria crotonensis]|nr:hypothetical protein MHU86_6186 [Fragilaria crotonensis]
MANNDDTNNNDVDESVKAAEDEMNMILNETRPKHFGHGVWSGVESIVGGGIGAIGIAVLTPVQGAAIGARQAGILGGAVGVLGGTVVGVVHAANVAAGGVVHGVSQIVRGAVNTPDAIIAPRQGKWWNENEGAWIATNLKDDEQWLSTQPPDNDDILGSVRAAFLKSPEGDGEEEKGEEPLAPQVKDTYYYDLLGVPTNVNESTVKRQYYILARRYSPDRAGQSEDAARKFREIGTAYVVLMNPAFREQYDKHGVGFMDADHDESSESEQNETPLVDPMVLYGMLFGSDKFQEYTGCLAAATSASVGDSPDITKVQARLLQKRRVTALALKLAERLQDYTEDKVAIAKAHWKTEAEYLTKASYGTELTNLIGKVYTIAAIQFLGSLTSGVGLPGMTAWAKKQQADLKKTAETSAFKVSRVVGDTDLQTVRAAISSSDFAYKSPEEQAQLQKELNEQLRATLLRSMWTTTVLDITNTLHEAIQMVLFDLSVDPEIRRKRAEGLKLLGEIFNSQPRPEGPNFAMDGQLSYEEVAFAAMLETCVRKEQWSQHAYQQQLKADLEAKE